MKTNILTLLLLAFSLLTARPLVAQNDIKEQLIVPLSDPNKPGTLRASLINGSIRVMGYSGKEVVIDVFLNPPKGKRTDKPSDDKAANGMKRINAGNGLEISAEEKNNTVNVQTNSIHQAVDLTIKVPQQFSLRVSTINQGEIVIENVNGELEVNNVNGSIQLTNISGSAVANTINGDLKATFRSVNTDAPMAFATLNGNIDVTFPPASKINVKLKTDRGEIYSDFDIDVNKNQPKVNKSSQNGMYRVTIDDWVEGKVNGGGREIMMKNMNGNIYVRKAK